MSDPFGGDGDRTILKPTPGGQPATGAPPPLQPQSPPRPAPTAEDISLRASGRNGLVNSAAPLFALVSQLRGSVSHPDPLSLQAHVAQEIMNFEAQARQAGEAPEQVLAARYALCTLLDEAALSTPWGAESQWANQTLLVRFHNEARGGEKFFQILERLLQDPAGNLNLLELMYVCLALGFEGRYRMQPRGQADLELVRQSVYETIRNFRGEVEQDLSLRWRGIEDKRPRLAQYVPLWVLGAVGASLALLVYVGFLFALNAQTDPVVGQVARLARDTVPLETRASLPVVQSVTLEDVLGEDPLMQSALRDGLARVTEGDNRSTVQMWNLFPSGQGTVGSDSTPLVASLGAALAQFNGRVQIFGHTDNEPISLSRVSRFPDNWSLSERRAESVREILGQNVNPARLSVQGLADSQPLVPNDSAVNMALNRRVEVTLFYEMGEL